LADGTPAPLEREWESNVPPSPPPFDEKMARTAVELFLWSIDKVCCGIVRGVTLGRTHDVEAAAVAAKTAEMDREYRERLTTAGIEWARQEQQSFQKFPKYIFCGGIVAHGIGVIAQCKAIREDRMQAATEGGAP
jgi:hypothetical protein